MSRSNLLRALGSVAAKAASSAKSIAADTDIRNRILAELDRQLWAPRAQVSVVVWDGNVHFWGTITDEKQREALRILVEAVPGVEGVHDHLVYVEPIPSMVM